MKREEKLQTAATKPMTLRQKCKYEEVVRSLAKLNGDSGAYYLLGTLHGRLKISEWQRAQKAKRDARKREKESKRSQ